MPSVVLTREKGKNGKLAKLLDERQISWVELPLVETIDGPDRSVLCLQKCIPSHDMARSLDKLILRVYFPGLPTSIAARKQACRKSCDCRAILE